jgi:hypothetical protein
VATTNGKLGRDNIKRGPDQSSYVLGLKTRSNKTRMLKVGTTAVAFPNKLGYHMELKFCWNYPQPHLLPCGDQLNSDSN